MLHDGFFEKDFYLSVSYDFEAREKHELVYKNMMLSPVPIAVLVLVSPTILQKDVDEMIRMSLQSGANVALVGVELPPNYGEQYTSMFKNMYIELADAYDLTLIEGSIKEMVALNLMQADGIHPNASGHLRIEEEVRSKILSLLDESIID